MFSRTTEYAIRALTFLAAQPPGKLSGAREIAGAERIPMPFLWKILQRLSRQGLIRSFRGVRGGYELARPPFRISIDAILKGMGSTELATACVLGLPKCRGNHRCPLHPVWDKTRDSMTRALRTTSLADLAVWSKDHRK